MLQALKQLVSRELRPRTGLELAQGPPGAGPHKDREEAWAQELLPGLLLWAREQQVERRWSLHWIRSPRPLAWNQLRQTLPGLGRQARRPSQARPGLWPSSLAGSPGGDSPLHA